MGVLFSAMKQYIKGLGTPTPLPRKIPKISTMHRPTNRFRVYRKQLNDEILKIKNK